MARAVAKALSADDRNLRNRAQLLASLELFIRVFLPLVSGRDFFLSTPVNREPHQRTVIRELEKAANLQLSSLIINIPPGHGKSMLVSMFVAWTMARYPDSQYLYISYSVEIARKHTTFIRSIMQTLEYQSIFDVHIPHSDKAKERFMTNRGGAIRAFGAAGAIVGQDAGLPNVSHFSGCVIMDDLHKINEIHSQKVRAAVITNYQETILQRVRSDNVPMISIGHRLHQEDVLAYQLSGNDVRTWTPLILPAIDEHGHALAPDIISLQMLQQKQEKLQYVFASQYQQDPIPSGGAMFRECDFVILEETPKIICTFIAVDTAETSNEQNDATVFSHFGVYKIEQAGIEGDVYGLHWLDCVEHRIEPKDLETAFLSFFSGCMRFPVHPRYAPIEQKSTGVTLISVLQKIRGLVVMPIKRTVKDGSKAARFESIQWYIASKLISFTDGDEHVDMCIKHMAQITRNQSHAHDDIADTLYDAIKLVLIDKNPLFLKSTQAADAESRAIAGIFQADQVRMAAKQASWQHNDTTRG